MKLTSLLGYTLLSSSLILSGCGDDESDNSSEKSAVATTARASALVDVDDECMGGGILLETGADTNADGVLQDDEVSKSQKVCNGLDGSQGVDGLSGDDGADGLSTLISQSAETNRSRCANGGIRFEIGFDTNKSGVLDFNEVNATSWVCNGTDGEAGAKGNTGSSGSRGSTGATGAAGVDGVDGAYAGAGFDALINAETIASGEECSYGGQKFDTGLDLNRNQLLDSEEVTDTAFVCNGIAGANGVDGLTSLIEDSVVSAGEICSAGGININIGVDANANNILDQNEITGNKVLCHGEQGTAGLNGSDGTNGISTLVEYTAVEEAICASGGFQIDVGQDLNGNLVLDDSEAVSVGSICNGSSGEDGTNGLNALVIQSVESMGQNCASGGVRFDVGIDDNQNALLDEAEIDTTEFTCNGLAGGNGIDGIDGKLSLINQTDLETSASCTAGAIQFDAGIDDNNNGVLEQEEIDNSRTLCNGADGTNGADGANGTDGADGDNGSNGLSALISQSAVTDINICPAGGIRFDVGIDVNGNQTLEEAEIDSSEIVCSGIAGEDGVTGEVGATGQDGVAGQDGVSGLNALIEQTELIVGDVDCPFGGVRFDVGIDQNRNGELNGVSGIIGDEITGVDYICEKQNPLSSNARLDGIKLSVGELDQVFQSSVTEYSAWVNYLASTVELTVYSEDVNATIRINGESVLSGMNSSLVELVEGDNTITIDVTAEDGESKSTYSIKLTRQYLNMFAQKTYFKADSNAEPDIFGNTLDMEGDTLVVGSPNKSVGYNQNGAVYIFRKVFGLWRREAKLISPDSSDYDHFGQKISLSGNTLAVFSYEDGHGLNSGAVYIYRRYGDRWHKEEKITASNAGEKQVFGYPVALQGDTLVAGSMGESTRGRGVNQPIIDNNANEVDTEGDGYYSGAVYVFKRTPTGWVQEAHIKASNSDKYDRFGISVAIDNNLIAVASGLESSAGTGVNSGMQDDNSESTSGSGAVYVFEHNGSDWEQAAYIKASNTGGGDRFGLNIALSNNTLAVSASGEASGSQVTPEDNSTPFSGAVYVFDRVGGEWGQTAYIKSSTIGAYDVFGNSLVLDKNILVVGTPGDDSGATGINGDESNNDLNYAGSLEIFVRTEGAWERTAYVKSLWAKSFQGFASDIALSEGRIAVGVPGDSSAGTGIDSGMQNDESVLQAGAVLLFE